MWCKLAVLPLLACLAGAAAGAPHWLSAGGGARTSTLSPAHQAAIKDVYEQLMQIKQDISNGETNISNATAATASGTAVEKRGAPASTTGDIILSLAGALLLGATCFCSDVTMSELAEQYLNIAFWVDSRLLDRCPEVGRIGFLGARRACSALFTPGYFNDWRTPGIPSLAGIPGIQGGEQQQPLDSTGITMLGSCSQPMPSYAEGLLVHISSDPAARCSGTTLRVGSHHRSRSPPSFFTIAMVLTRRAYKSIIRWLPNEILTAVMSHLLTSDLLALCRTSRLMRNIATPLLYRTISLSTMHQMHTFIRTLEQSSGSASSFWRHVRQFDITDENEFAHRYRNYPNHVAILPPGVPRPIACRIRIHDCASRCIFPNLATFLYTVQSQSWALLTAFLNRHPTITELSLPRHGPIPPLGPICLPNLQTFTGPSSFVSALSAESAPIRSVFIIWYAEDRDIETPLLRLGKMASPAKIVALTASENVTPVAILAAVATHLPDIKTLRFGQLYIAPRTLRATLDMTAQLKRFTSLSVLDVIGPNDEEFTTDRETIELWSEACKSLSSIVIQGREWNLAVGRWEMD
ncbi:hypothetical protein B0H14DRAFT_3767925 [Mycena olivaceomarginata]|nr:hypothetical protein B0H14DRAFT_3767925 [Mycena olivaceomarginata]